MPTSWSRFVWQQPVGMPHTGSILTVSSSSSLTVMVEPFAANASHFQLFESGGYNPLNWTAMTRRVPYTFATSGSKRLYCAFRNPSFFVIGDDLLIYQDVAVNTTATSGAIWQIMSEIIEVVRADATLSQYHANWADTTSPHVMGGWSSEDVKAINERNMGRLPFVEIKAGPASVVRDGAGCMLIDQTFKFRAWITVPVDGDSVERESLVLKFLWDIIESLNAYPTLDTNQWILDSSCRSWDPGTDNGRSYRVATLDHVVRANIPLQDLT